MDKTILGEAMLFALEKHKGQQYGQKPYHVHLLDVVNVLRRFVDWNDMTQRMIDAAWLHDVVEDTDTTLEEVNQKFGAGVAALVDAVTNGEGKNRKERAAATYPKIRNMPHAILIKLADRIANLENCVSHDRIGRRPGKLFDMYEKEWEAFQAELRQRCRGEGAVGQLMWLHLDEIFSEGKRQKILIPEAS
jgi:(p)ppGpp synthase/HD superfamily hydrolase